MKKKFKVLLFSLPTPAVNLNKYRHKSENVPLACGYLKGYADASGLSGEVTIDIAPQELMSFGGDSALISYINGNSYDLLGCSLYQWNSLRSLHIMKEVKKRNPGVLLLAGGPEISQASDYLKDDEALDFMIEGEGEQPFRKLLMYLTTGRPSLEEIPGLFYRQKNTLFYHAPGDSLKDLSSIPSPYLSGIIDLQSHRVFHMETMRGCVYGCKYCAWKRGGRHGVSFFPIERLRQEFRLAREMGIRSIRVLDGSINVSKEWLGQFCRMIIEENRDRFVEIHGNLHPEVIDEESAIWLSEANFTLVTVGLQSTNPEVLKLIGRNVNFEKYLRGTSFLAEHRVVFLSSIILGLPGDTIEGFKKTMDFLLDHNQKRVICCPLSVSPNTHLRFEAEELGLRYQKMPPNLLLSTPTMDFATIKQGISLFRERFVHLPNDGLFEKDIHITGRHNFPVEHYLYRNAFPSLVTYVDGACPRSNGKSPADSPSQDTLEKALASSPSSRPTRLILSRKCRQADSAAIEKMAGILAPRLCWNTLLWLKDFGSEDDIRFIRQFLSIISEENPFHIWQFVLEFEREAPIQYLSEFAASLRCLPGLLDYESLYEQTEPVNEYRKAGPFIYAVIPCDAPQFSRQWLESLSRDISVFWHLSLPKGYDDVPEIGDGFVADFSPDAPPSQILYTLNVMNQSRDTRPIFFKNWVIQRLWALYCMGNVKIWGADDNVLDCIESDKVIFTDFSDLRLRTHMLEWIRSRKKSRTAQMLQSQSQEQ